MRQKTIKKALQKTDFSDGASHSHACSKRPRLTPPVLWQRRRPSLPRTFCSRSTRTSCRSASRLELQSASAAAHVDHWLAVRQMQVVNLIFLLGSRASQLRKVLAPRSPALQPPPTRPPARPRPLARLPALTLLCVCDSAGGSSSLLRLSR